MTGSMHVPLYFRRCGAGANGAGALPQVPGMKKKRGRPSKADLAAREAYAAQLEAEEAAAAARATASSPEPLSPSSHNRQRAPGSPSAGVLGVVSPDGDISISSAETQSEVHEPGGPAAAKAPAGKGPQARGDVSSQARAVPQDRAVGKAVPKGQALKAAKDTQHAKQDQAGPATPAAPAAAAEQHASTTMQSKHAAGAVPEAAPVAADNSDAPQAAALRAPKRKKAVHVIADAVPMPLASAAANAIPATAITAAQKSVAPAPQQTEAASSLQPPALPEEQAPAGAAVQAVEPPKVDDREFPCARARPWTRHLKKTGTSSDETPPSDEQQAQAGQPADANQNGAAAVNAGRAATATAGGVDTATAATTATAAALTHDSKGHVGSSGRIPGPQHNSNSPCRPGPADQIADAQRSPTSRRAGDVPHANSQSAPRGQRHKGPHGQFSNEEAHGQLSSEQVGDQDSLRAAGAGAGHTGESSAELPMSQKSSKHALPADQRSKSSYRGTNAMCCCCTEHCATQPAVSRKSSMHALPVDQRSRLPYRSVPKTWCWCWANFGRGNDAFARLYGPTPTQEAAVQPSAHVV